ncbi:MULTISPECIES: hypothetical protein [Pseudoalteromonas]|uniref:hypothetical protein n=1 Tax=Pseudoalteromonas TaxID=53246 RepID=UPI0007839890|nr:MULTISPECIES: hypothetical protein [Pseudoalteromonas]MCF7517861.1 hypothetical protein [Pseudoalteromonas sp. L21]UJX27263.1 hypothetical protein L3Q70_18590 [Pseudoalteromonas sp. CF6-2]|tara:strand:+ start:211 stop:495 length:285 start_codon:yes stop_codon:yes gene_type:complete
MKYLYTLTILIQTFAIIILYQDPNYQTLALIFAPAILLSLFGGLYFIFKNKWLAYTGMLGCVVFVPIGALGVFALRSEMDNEIKRDFLRSLRSE